MESPSAAIDRDQMSLQQRCLRVDTAALCDDVENVVGDVLCDGFDELEGILGAEETVTLGPGQIREVRGGRCAATPRALRQSELAGFTRGGPCPPCALCRSISLVLASRGAARARAGRGSGYVQVPEARGRQLPRFQVLFAAAHFRDQPRSS
jgi:hypothetical protein